MIFFKSNFTEIEQRSR